MKKIVFALTALFATFGAAQAQTAEPAVAPVRFLVGMGLSGGGDKLASAKYTDGSTISLHGGGLIYFTGGLDYRVTPEFSLQGTVNFHVDQAAGKNGDIQFRRFPVELIGYYQFDPKWRAGAGVRYTISPELSSSGVVSGMDVSFDNSVGAIIEGEYFVNPKMGIKLRYVKETLKSKGYGDVDGSHVGMSANFYF